MRVVGAARGPDRVGRRHSRDDGIPAPWLVAYRNRMVGFSGPTAQLPQLAYEMTTADAAMSMYLNGNQNVRGRPNENYARELMELFCLGPKDPTAATTTSRRTSRAWRRRSPAGG